MHRFFSLISSKWTHSLRAMWALNCLFWMNTECACADFSIKVLTTSCTSLCSCRVLAMAKLVSHWLHWNLARVKSQHNCFSHYVTAERASGVVETDRRSLVDAGRTRHGEKGNSVVSTQDPSTWHERGSSQGVDCSSNLNFPVFSRPILFFQLI